MGMFETVVSNAAKNAAKEAQQREEAAKAERDEQSRNPRLVAEAARNGSMTPMEKERMKALDPSVRTDELAAMDEDKQATLPEPKNRTDAQKRKEAERLKMLNMPKDHLA